MDIPSHPVAQMLRDSLELSIRRVRLEPFYSTLSEQLFKGEEAQLGAFLNFGISQFQMCRGGKSQRVSTRGWFFRIQLKSFPKDQGLCKEQPLHGVLLRRLLRSLWMSMRKCGPRGGYHDISGATGSRRIQKMTRSLGP